MFVRTNSARILLSSISSFTSGIKLTLMTKLSITPTIVIQTGICGASNALIAKLVEIDEPVLVHGDACAPNTLISPAGEWVGNVDFGDLGVGDRWADLAIASLSLDWNFGEGHQPELFAAYGIDPDEDRIHYYRALWHQES